MADNEEQANLVVAAVNEAKQTLQEIQKGFEDFEGSAQSLGITSVALGGILKDILMKAFSELKDMVKLGINEAIDAEQIQMKLANSFKAEGDAAKTSITYINKMADSLGALTGIDNDNIVATATMLRQMTGLSAEMIGRMMPAIVDLSVKTGSLESATSMVARAMNGHARGLSMLGVEFKSTGDKARDMDTLMGKLNEKFGGLAQENLKTTGGQFSEMKTIFSDTAQVIGETVIQSNLFQAGIRGIKSALIDLRNALQGNPGSAEYIAKLTETTQKIEKDLPDAIQLSAAAMTALTNRSVETTEVLGLNEKKKVEEVKLTADQTDALREFHKKREIENNLAIFDNQVAFREKDKADRDLRAEELIAKSAADIEEQKRIEAELAQYREDQENQRIAKSLEMEAYLLQVKTAMEMEAGRAASAAFQGLADAMGQTFSLALQGGSDVTAKLKAVWNSFGTFLLDLIGRLVARLLVFKALSMILGPTGSIFGMGAKALMGMQTASGSTRMVPGPPSLAVPVMAHGGETIGRGGFGGGGGTIIIEGNYFESEEANARLFDAQRRYKKRNGFS